jgi:hypothetical protein
MLRDNVTDALKDAESPLVHRARDWRQLLFPVFSNSDQHNHASGQELLKCQEENGLLAY